MACADRHHGERVNTAPRTIIFLNGTSSSGKTSLARALQDLSQVPFLYWGIDCFFSTVPRRWGAGYAGPLSSRGFRYDRWTTNENGKEYPVTMVRVGDLGLEMLKATYHAVGVLAQSQRLIIDEMLLLPHLLSEWTSVLPRERTLFVGLHCDLETLEAREKQRNSPPGLARGHFTSVHPDPGQYDLWLDTAAHSPDELARTVLDA